MTLLDAMREACQKVRIVPPQRTREGVWVRTPVEGKSKSNGSGSVMIFEDHSGGVAFNWATGQSITFRPDGTKEVGYKPPPPDPLKARRLAEKRAEVSNLCQQILGCCRTDHHAYLARKGFPSTMSLVIERDALPDMPRATRAALPAGEGPLLVIPGRVGRTVTTLQFITEDGDKKNILGGTQKAACHRVSRGVEIWVAEGIATALTVREALKFLGRSACVYAAFSAANVATVARGMRGAIIAADHDRSIEQFDGVGTGEYYAAKSGCRWTMPPSLGDFNDWHASDGLRAVALHLREVKP